MVTSYYFIERIHEAIIINKNIYNIINYIFKIKHLNLLVLNRLTNKIVTFK